MASTDQDNARRLDKLERQCDLLLQALEAVEAALKCEDAETERKLCAHAQVMLEEVRS